MLSATDLLKMKPKVHTGEMKYSSWVSLLALLMRSAKGKVLGERRETNFACQSSL